MTEAERIARLERAFVSLVAELGSRADTHGTIRALVEDDKDVRQLVAGSGG